MKRAPHMHYCPVCKRDFHCGSLGHDDGSNRVCTGCRRRQARWDAAEHEHALYRFIKESSRLRKGLSTDAFSF